MVVKHFVPDFLKKFLPRDASIVKTERFGPKRSANKKEPCGSLVQDTQCQSDGAHHERNHEGGNESVAGVPLMKVFRYPGKADGRSHDEEEEGTDAEEDGQDGRHCFVLLSFDGLSIALPGSFIKGFLQLFSANFSQSLTRRQKLAVLPQNGQPKAKALA